MNNKKEMWDEMPKVLELSKYQISNYGNVRVKSNKYKQNVPFSAKKIKLMTDENEMEYFKLKFLVALRFVPNPDNLPKIINIDGDIENNTAWNLRWVTATDYEIKNAKSGAKSSMTVSVKKGIKTARRLSDSFGSSSPGKRPIRRTSPRILKKKSNSYGISRSKSTSKSLPNLPYKI